MTRFHQHMGERKKIINQDGREFKQTFFVLNEQLQPHHLVFIEQQLTINQPQTLLILKYCELVQQTID